MGKHKKNYFSEFECEEFMLTCVKVSAPTVFTKMYVGSVQSMIVVYKRQLINRQNITDVNNISA